MRIRYKKRFEKGFKKLPPKVREQFFARLEILIANKFNPILNNHSVDAAYPDCRSINITGDVRAIFQEHKDEIIFILIGTHSQLY